MLVAVALILLLMFACVVGFVAGCFRCCCLCLRLMLLVVMSMLFFQCVAIVGFVVVCDRCCWYCLCVVDVNGCGAVDAVVCVVVGLNIDCVR